MGIHERGRLMKETPRVGAIRSELNEGLPALMPCPVRRGTGTSISGDGNVDRLWRRVPVRDGEPTDDQHLYGDGSGAGLNRGRSKGGGELGDHEEKVTPGFASNGGLLNSFDEK